MRETLARQAKFLGAVRLPANVFGNTGTDVTTDLIFLQKRERELDPQEINLQDPEFSFINTELTDVVNSDGEQQVVNLNCYFKNHPEMIAGDLTWVSSQYGPKMAVKAENAFTNETLNRIKNALSNIQKNDRTFVKTQAEVRVEDNGFLNDPNFVKAPSYSIYIDSKGGIQKKNNNYSKPISFNVAEKNRAQVLALIQIRDLYQKIRLGELQNQDESNLKIMRSELSNAYDTYYAKYHTVTDQRVRNARIKALKITAEDDRELMIKEADIPDHFAIPVSYTHLTLPTILRV